MLTGLDVIWLPDLLIVFDRINKSRSGESWARARGTQAFAKNRLTKCGLNSGINSGTQLKSLQVYVGGVSPQIKVFQKFLGSNGLP